MPTSTHRGARATTPRELPNEPRVIALIDELLAGSAGAWPRLVELIYPEIERFARFARSMQPLRDSEDHRLNVVADVLEKLQGADKTYRALALSVAWRAEFPHLRLGNWLHTVVTRVASTYVGQLLGQHHAHIAVDHPAPVTRLVLLAQGSAESSLPAASEALKLRDLSVKFGKGEPWSPRPKVRHTFVEGAPRLEVELPTGRRAISYVNIEYVPGRDTTELQAWGWSGAKPPPPDDGPATDRPGWVRLGQCVARDKASANRRLLHTLATELPSVDDSPGFRPPVTDMLTNQQRAAEALTWAAQNLTPAQLRALLAWSDGAGFVEIGRADVLETRDRGWLLEVQEQVAAQDAAAAPAVAAWIEANDATDIAALADPAAPATAAIEAVLARHGERLVRAARAKFDRKAKREAEADT